MIGTLAKFHLRPFRTPANRFLSQSSKINCWSRRIATSRFRMSEGNKPREWFLLNRIRPGETSIAGPITSDELIKLANDLAPGSDNLGNISKRRIAQILTQKRDISILIHWYEQAFDRAEADLDMNFNEPIEDAYACSILLFGLNEIHRMITPVRKLPIHLLLRLRTIEQKVERLRQDLHLEDDDPESFICELHGNL